MNDFHYPTADLGRHTLIEASAGTGKTFVLECLLERLLTESWTSELLKPLLLQEILVVTYTEKATQELRERIQTHLKMSLKDAAISDSKKRVLKTALLECDLASIHTLHGFCQKLLGEFALDCGADFMTEVGGEEALTPLIQDGFRKWENVSEGKDSLKSFLSDFKNREEAEIFLLKLFRSEVAQAIKEQDPWATCVPNRENVLKELADQAMTAAANSNRERALRCDFLYRFLSDLLETFQKYKAEQHRLTYDDMIRKVHDAVVLKNNKKLLRGIRERYRAVLLDEFQDTDRRQWEIFETIFVKNTLPGPLFLVGDPKQAIYRFRGADLPVYFHAKEVLNHAFPLSVNHRSHPNLLEGLNRLFILGPLFPKAQPIQYSASSAPTESRTQVFLEDGAASAPIEFLSLPKNKAGASRALLYAHIAQTLVRFLSSHSPFRLGEQKIRLKDVALLTRTNKECQEAAEVLRRHGIPCVITSPESLWQTEEAKDLEIFLRALDNPEDESLIKRALLTFFFELHPQELLNLPENQMEFYREQFWEWHNSLDTTRLSQALKQIWIDLSVFCKQLNYQDGDQRVTCLNHLLEKIIDQENEGNLSLEEWGERLRDLRKQPEGEKDALRLETDEEAVSILTIHKSKGLEFSIVFFAGGLYKKNSQFKTDICHYSEQRKKVFELYASGKGRAKAAEEQESEYRRLLYVAMTRAKSKLFLPLFPKTSHSQSLVDLLWNTDTAIDFSNFISDPTNAAFMTLTRIKLLDDMKLLRSETQSTVPYGEHFQKRTLSCTDFSTRGRSWTSFTALTQNLSYKTPLESTLLFDDDMKLLLSGTRSAMEPCGELLPKGVETGNLLHHVLETLPFEWLAAYPSQEALEKNETDFSKLNTFLQRALRRYALSTEYLKALRNIVWNTLKTFLPAPHPFTLSDLKHRKHEMEFVLAVQPHLKTVLRLDLEEPVEFRFDMNAFFLRGFVDMIFEYEEKYYIVDWKSNHLGDSPEEYTQSRILESIREQRYFLQYSLYTTALCFFLKKQNPQFSFEKNFGGVYYLYLRGMKENASTGIFFHKPKREELCRFTASFLDLGKIL